MPFHGGQRDLQANSYHSTNYEAHKMRGCLLVDRA